MEMVGHGRDTTTLRLPPGPSQQLKTVDAQGNRPATLDLAHGDVRKLKNETATLVTLEASKLVDRRMHTGADRRQHHRIYVREGDWKGSYGVYIASHERKKQSDPHTSTDPDEPKDVRATIRLEQNGTMAVIPLEHLWDWFAFLILCVLATDYLNLQ
jgi:hypothetical protein